MCCKFFYVSIFHSFQASIDKIYIVNEKKTDIGLLQLELLDEMGILVKVHDYSVSMFTIFMMVI